MQKNGFKHHGVSWHTIDTTTKSNFAPGKENTRNGEKRLQVWDNGNNHTEITTKLRLCHPNCCSSGRTKEELTRTYFLKNHSELGLFLFYFYYFQLPTQHLKNDTGGAHNFPTNFCLMKKAQDFILINNSQLICLCPPLDRDAGHPAHGKGTPPNYLFNSSQNKIKNYPTLFEFLE